MPFLRAWPTRAGLITSHSSRNLLTDILGCSSCSRARKVSLPAFASGYSLRMFHHRSASRCSCTACCRSATGMPRLSSTSTETAWARRFGDSLLSSRCIRPAGFQSSRAPMFRPPSWARTKRNRWRRATRARCDFRKSRCWAISPVRESHSPRPAMPSGPFGKARLGSLNNAMGVTSTWVHWRLLESWV